MEDKEEVTNDPQRTGNKETSQGLERKMPKYNKKKKNSRNVSKSVEDFP